MNDDPASAKPRPETPTPVFSLPTRRIKNPYFALKAADRVSTYFDEFNIRVVKSASEPIAPFLANPEVKLEERTQVVSYHLGPVSLVNLRPMKFLPLGVVEAFEKAAQAFYLKAHKDSKASPVEKDLRRIFRLPDPDLEPDAYWIYGERFDPKLLILWGCESEKGTSLPLVRDDELGLKNVPTVAEKLRQRVLSWDQLQKEALELIATTNDPLGRFLAFPVLNSKGDLVAIEQQGIQVPIKQFKVLKTTAPAKEVHAFKAAAAEFYRRSHEPKCACELCAAVTAKEAARKARTDPGAAVTEKKPPSAYEKELRRGFMLPDPSPPPKPSRGSTREAAPEEAPPPKAYWVAGGAFSGRLLILCRCTDQRQEHPLYKKYEYTRTDCLCLATDEVLGVPVAKTGEPEAQISAIFKDEAATDAAAHPTVASRLKPTSIGKLLLRAAAVLGVLLVLWGSYYVLVPHAPFPLLKAELSNDPQDDPANAHNALIATFKRPVNPKSLTASPPGPAQNFALLEGTANSILKVERAAVDAKNGARVVLKLSGPLLDGKTYTLTAQGLRDRFGNGLVTNAHAAIALEDLRPPAATNATAAWEDRDTGIRIEFNEALDKTSAANPANYSMAGFQFRPPVLEAGGKTVLLEAMQPFESDRSYQLQYSGIADASPRKNATNGVLSFTYTRLPLRIQTVEANLDQFTVMASFNKKVDAVSAQVAANYAVESDLLKVVPVTVTNDSRTVVLRASAPIRARTNYVLKVQGVKDLAGHELKDQRPFRLGVAPDEKPPDPVEALPHDDDKTVTLVFSEPVTGPAISDAKRFLKLLEDRRKDGTYEELALAFTLAAAEDPSRLELKLAERLPKGAYKVTYSGIEDRVGNTKPGEFALRTDIGIVERPGAYIDGVTRQGGKAIVRVVVLDELDASSYAPANFTFLFGGKSVHPEKFEPSKGLPVRLNLPLPADATLEGDYKLSWTNMRKRNYNRIFDLVLTPPK